MIRATHSPLFVTKELLETRYKGAEVIFLAGSVMRGEASAYSDIDLVVVYPHVDKAYRESFTHKEWPVEAFVHDPRTLSAWFNTDIKRGHPSLPMMVFEGLEVPAPSGFSDKLKDEASLFLSHGPLAMSSAEIDDARYELSNLLDDLREPRSREELTATASTLYNKLADFYLSARGEWTAEGKSVLRLLKKADPAFSRRFVDAFETLYTHNQASKVVSLAEDVLQPYGGILFEGYKRLATEDI